MENPFSGIQCICLSIFFQLLCIVETHCTSTILTIKKIINLLLFQIGNQGNSSGGVQMSGSSMTITRNISNAPSQVSF